MVVCRLPGRDQFLRRYASVRADLDITRVVAIAAAVSTQIIGQIRTDAASEALRSGGELRNLVCVEIAKLFEIRMLQELRRGPPLVFVVYQHPSDDFLSFRRDVLDSMDDALAFLVGRKIDLHVRRVAREVIEELFGRCANAFVDLIDLIELVLAREQRTQAEHLVHNATDTPNVHLVRVIAVG